MKTGQKKPLKFPRGQRKYKIKKRPVALNDIHPLWNKHPNECTEEEYKEFYRKVFMDFKGAAVLDPSEHGLSV